MTPDRDRIDEPVLPTLVPREPSERDVPPTLPAGTGGLYPVAETLPPRLADRFEVRGRIGAGGMGIVYEAYDEVRGELVALKTIPRGDPKRVYDLKREFRALADLVHPRLVRLHELFTDGNVWFFTMQRLSGVPFTEHARDEATLRAVLRDLVEGVHAIHRAGKLHRDLKPSNVLVAAGRAVILDFGLVAPVRREAGTVLEIAGTPAYMAPELMWGDATPASDWYAVGVMLYEALAGVLPKPDAPPPAGPADLAALAAELVRRDPAGRPDEAEIAARVGAPEPDPRGLDATRLVGRDTELAQLDAAYRGALPALVRIAGPSGIGKSALVDEFVAAHREAIVLRGRCYEREAIPFKALDPIVDALAQRLADDDADVEVPAHADELCRVFPVLGRVFPRRADGADDPQEARGRAFAGLAELLADVARTGPLVIAIDDAQWGDADSAVLLAHLLDAAIPALWIVGHRADEASPLVAALGEVRVASHAIELAPLDAGASRALARALLPEPSDEHVATLARESGGNPFFLAELARGGRSASLSELVQRRVEALEPEPRRVLELVALAGAPIPLAVVLAAAGLARDAVVPELRGRSLVRTNGAHVETYHDRIREAVIARIAAEPRRAHHRALGEALEAVRAPVDLLALHFREAGERDRACSYTLEAAAAANRALAFDRAAALYQQAIALSAPDAELECRAGDAFANAGRGPDAAEAYLRAAELVDPAERLELQRRAAHQYLSTGQIGRGREIGWRVIQQLGMWIPKRPFTAQLVALVRFGTLVMRGYKAPRRETDDPLALRQYDVTNELFQNLANHESMHGFYFAASASLRGVRLVDPVRRAGAIGNTAALMCLVRGAQDRRIERWLAEQRAIATSVGTPAALAVAATYDGVCATYVGAWRRAGEWLAEAERLFAQCEGIAFRFQVTTGQALDSWLLYFRGELAELARRTQRRLADAKAKHNTMGVNAQTTHVSIAGWLVRDDVAGAAHELAAAEHRMPDGGYGNQHVWLLQARSMLSIYAGEGVAGHARLLAELPDLKRSRLFAIKIAYSLYLHTHAALALAAADELGTTPRADRLRRDAARLADKLARLPTGGSVPLADLVRAAVAPKLARGALLERAQRGFLAADMPGFAAAAGWQLGGPERAAAEAWFAGEAVARPERFVALLAPGFRG